MIVPNMPWSTPSPLRQRVVPICYRESPSVDRSRQFDHPQLQANSLVRNSHFVRLQRGRVSPGAFLNACSNGVMSAHSEPSPPSRKTMLTRSQRLINRPYSESNREHNLLQMLESILPRMSTLKAQPHSFDKSFAGLVPLRGDNFPYR